MVRTGVGGRTEHAIAYFGTAIIMALAYRERPRLLVQFLLLVVLAGILEVGQLYVPGRTAAFLDFAASSTGAALGALLMWVVRPSLLSFTALDRPTTERS
jgi:VanZ family protein